MGFKEYIINYFPHRWLDLKKDGTGRLFGGIGNTFDNVRGDVGVLIRNSSTRTALEALADIENEYGIPVNPSNTAELRRAKIIAKMRTPDSPVTKPDLLKMLEALDVKASVETGETAYIMHVCFETSGKFAGVLEEINEILTDNVRAHVVFQVVAESVNVIGVGITSYYVRFPYRNADELRAGTAPYINTAGASAAVDMSMGADAVGFGFGNDRAGQKPDYNIPFHPRNSEFAVAAEGTGNLFRASGAGEDMSGRLPDVNVVGQALGVSAGMDADGGGFGFGYEQTGRNPDYNIRFHTLNGELAVAAEGKGSLFAAAGTGEGMPGRLPDVNITGGASNDSVLPEVGSGVFTVSYMYCGTGQSKK